MSKVTIAKIVIMLFCIITSSYLFTTTATKQHQGIDCHKVKETCNRKKGCKCKLNCDTEGRRLPPAGGPSECPSYCCEEKCECHAMGCP
jgi:hypothetical protein